MNKETVHGLAIPGKRIGKEIKLDALKKGSKQERLYPEGEAHSEG